MKKSILLVSLLASTSLGACSFHARGPEDYKKDTRALLETRDSQIRECYEKLLKEDKKAEGKVVLKFVVKSESGAITNVKASTKDGASEELSACVTEAVAGLKLDPPDQRDGNAEFVYEFKQK